MYVACEHAAGVSGSSACARPQVNASSLRHKKHVYIYIFVYIYMYIYVCSSSHYDAMNTGIFSSEVLGFSSDVLICACICTGAH